MNHCIFIEISKKAKHIHIFLCKNLKILTGHLLTLELVLLLLELEDDDDEVDETSLL